MHRASRSRRAGHPGRHPRPGQLRRAVERPPVHPRRHRRLGARRHRPAGGRRRAGRVAMRRRGRRAARRRRERGGHGHRRGRRPRAAPLRPARAARRHEGRRRAARRGRRRAVAAGPRGAAPGQRAARPRHRATCSTRSWTRCPRARATLRRRRGGPRRVALVGKPNVGKSSLLNRVSGETRSVVHEVGGHDRRPRRLPRGAGRRGVAVRRHRGPAQAGQDRQRHGVLRQSLRTRPRSRPPRWRSCSIDAWRAASPSRTSG